MKLIDSSVEDVIEQPNGEVAPTATESSDSRSIAAFAWRIGQFFVSVVELLFAAMLFMPLWLITLDRWKNDNDHPRR